MAENESQFPLPEATGASSGADLQRAELHSNRMKETGHGRETQEANDEENVTGNEEDRNGPTSKENVPKSVENVQQRLESQSQLQQQQQIAGTQADRRNMTNQDHSSDGVTNQRVHKKSSANNKLTLYLVSRDLIVSESKIDKLQGVLLVDPDYLQDKRVHGQVTLTFRYGREDEEVMGLKFCNEAVMCLAQLYPPYAGAEHQEATSPLQEALVKRLGPNAYPFTMEITPLAPPSVQLVPAKEYNGAPIGTSYDMRVYIADRGDEMFHRKTTVRMGIRVIQRTTKPPLPAITMYSVTPSRTPSISSRLQSCRTKVTFAENNIEEDENAGPHAAVEKPFLLSDGRVGLEARLDRAIYAHGDTITVHVTVNNNSSKSVRRIKVFVVQHVDVCMFSNGKFKNVVALVSSQEGCPVGPGGTLKKSYTVRPLKGSTKNWIALEDNYTKAGATLASTLVTPANAPDDRNVFAIYVSYYVKVKLLISAMGGDVSLKLPFALMHSDTDPDLVVGFPSPIREPTPASTEKITEMSSSVPRNRERAVQKKKDIKLKVVKKKERESRIEDADLIEHCDDGDST